MTTVAITGDTLYVNGERPRKPRQPPFVKAEYVTVLPKPIPFYLALMYRRMLMQPRFGIVRGNA